MLISEPDSSGFFSSTREKAHAQGAYPSVPIPFASVQRWKLSQRNTDIPHIIAILQELLSKIFPLAYSSTFSIDFMHELPMNRVLFVIRTL